MRIRRHARAPTILLLAKALNHDRVLDRPQPVRRQRLHVENVNPLHLAENLETLETGRLLDVGGHGAGLGSLGKQVGFGLDLFDLLGHVGLVAGGGGHVGGGAVAGLVFGVDCGRREGLVEASRMIRGSTSASLAVAWCLILRTVASARAEKD